MLHKLFLKTQRFAPVRTQYSSILTGLKKIPKLRLHKRAYLTFRIRTNGVLGIQGKQKFVCCGPILYLLLNKTCFSKFGCITEKNKS